MKPTVAISLEEYERLKKPSKPYWNHKKLQKRYKDEYDRRVQLLDQLSAMETSRGSWRDVAADIERRFEAVTKELADLKRDFTLKVAAEKCKVEVSQKKAGLAMRMKWRATRRDVRGHEDPDHTALFIREEDARTWEQQNPNGGSMEYLG